MRNVQRALGEGCNSVEALGSQSLLQKCLSQWQNYASVHVDLLLLSKRPEAQPGDSNTLGRTSATWRRCKTRYVLGYVQARRARAKVQPSGGKLEVDSRELKQVSRLGHRWFYATLVAPTMLSLSKQRTVRQISRGVVDLCYCSSCFVPDYAWIIHGR